MVVRVLHVLESLRTDAGSPAIVFCGLPAALREHDVESTVLTAQPASGPNNAAQDVPFGPSRLQEAVDDSAVVHVHGGFSPVATAAVRYARSLGRPVVVSPFGHAGVTSGRRSPWWFFWRQDFATRRFLRRAVAVTAANPCELDQLQSARANSNVILLPYGFHFDAPPKPTVVASAASWTNRTILVLGPIVPSSGCILLLKCLAELGPQCDGWNVHLAGPVHIEQQKSLEAAFRRKKVMDRVRIIANPDADAQQELLASAALLVAPGTMPGATSSVLQALQAGVPLIASKPQAPFNLPEGVCVCEPTRDGLCRALRETLQKSDETRKTEGRKIREAARPLLDWSIRAAGFARLYRDVTPRAEL
jgi:glycosyltransferase involved in cell wall biosynthesis